MRMLFGLTRRLLLVHVSLATTSRVEILLMSGSHRGLGNHVVADHARGRLDARGVDNVTGSTSASGVVSSAAGLTHDAFADDVAVDVHVVFVNADIAGACGEASTVS